MKNQAKLTSQRLFSTKGILSAFLLLFTVTMMVSCSKQTPDQQADPSTGVVEGEDGQMVESAATGNTYYVSPSGNDNSAGTIDAPFKTLNKVWTKIVAGDIVYLRGGTYAFNNTQYLDSKNGTAASPIKIYGYPGEKPVLGRSTSYTQANSNELIMFSGNYFHFKDIEIANFSQRQGEHAYPAFRANPANNCTWENINYHHNAAAFSLKGNSSNNLFLNCDFSHNQDPYSASPYDGADGLDMHDLTGTNNTIRGCRAFWNADDGFDFWDNNGYVLIENSWSFFNGYIPGTFNTAGNGSGIKLGSTTNQAGTLLRTVKNNIVYKNRSYGIVENAAICKSNIFNNTAANNGDIGYWFGSWGTNVATLRNNISYNTPQLSRLSTNDIHDHNSWNGGVSLTAADFVSTDDSQLTRPRQANGSLPVITFLQLTSNSDLINAGVNVGLPYNGSAPDITSTETGGSGTPPANQAPTANAGADKSVMLPTSSVSITGSGSDPDGTIATYAWTRVSGPNTPTLSGAATTSLTASGLIAGTYVFRLTVTDNGGLTGTDNVTVVVSTSTPPANQAPVANAGADKTVTLPTALVSLTGSGTDPDGTIVSYTWTRVSGPNTPALAGATTTTLTATGLIAGVYTFRLTVKDNGNLTAYDDVKVTVGTSTPPVNQVPVVSAGPDKTITLPTSTITLNGTASDPDGTIVTYAWTYRNGPGAPTMAGTNTANLTASNLKAGTYTFRLTVTDNSGATAYDQVKVVVNPAASQTGTVLNMASAVLDNGNCYYIAKNFGTPADNTANPNRSKVRIFENGVELTPPHSKHRDIANIGVGRYSHWIDGGFEALYFSASDNTNPKTNGRTYTYIITQ